MVTEEEQLDHMGDMREEKPKLYTLIIKSHCDYPDLEDNYIGNSIEEAVEHFKSEYPDLAEFISEKDIYEEIK